MSVWYVAALVLVVATLPLIWLAVRGTPGDGVVAVQLTGLVASLAMLAFAEGARRQPFADLALVLAMCSFVGVLAFVRFLELGEREK